MPPHPAALPLPFRDVRHAASPAHAREAADLVETIRTTQRGIGTSDFQRWFSHPDERVPIAVLDRWGIDEIGNAGRPLIEDRATTLARQEPGVWSPIIDRVCSARWRAHPYQAAIDALGAWCRAQRDPAAIAALAPFRGAVFYHTVAAEWRAWTLELLARWADEGGPAVWPWLARNRAVKAPALTLHLGERALQALTQEPLPPGALDGAGATLDVLTRKGRAVPPDLAVRLLPAMQGAVDKTSSIGAGERAAAVIAGAPDYTAERAEAAYAIARRHDEVLRAYIKHPNTPLAHVRRALADRNTLRIRRAAATRRDALQDPAVREVLSASGEAADVLRKLLRDSGGGETTTLMARLVKQNTFHAVEALERDLPPDANVPLGVVQPLLKTERIDMRIKVARSLGKLRGRKP